MGFSVWFKLQWCFFCESAYPYICGIDIQNWDAIFLDVFFDVYKVPFPISFDYFQLKGIVLDIKMATPACF